MDLTCLATIVLVTVLLDAGVLADWIYHNDEIAYENKAKCFRGHTYYTNNPSANKTDIDLPSDFESYLSYDAGSDFCFYCVCSTNGKDIDCIRRDPWFCEYYKYIRDPKSIRETYSVMFKQDRPGYFQQLSWRLRRTMDDGLHALIESVGTDLDKSCVPFVSQYSDCVEENICTGCTRCLCSAEGDWVCRQVSECRKEPTPPVDEETLDNSLNTLYNEINKESKPKRKPKALVESVFEIEGKNEKRKEDLLLDNNDDDIEMQIVKLISSSSRKKRSVTELKPSEEQKRSAAEPKTNQKQKRAVAETKSNFKEHNSKKDENSKEHSAKKDENGTIRFYHTVNELDEDTLKNSNVSGTLGAPQVEPKIVPSLSRRTASMHENITDDHDLDSISNINYNHIMDLDNKIDTHGNETIDPITQEKVGILTNRTQKQKDSELSKLIVNELHGGTEYIGDKEGPVMSNITFTPENDTLTAMAFIAGNLLNKLWSMEKETSGESLETEAFKQERLADLLDLFKEPLTIRQEEFLKGALTKLSHAIEKKKDANDSLAMCDDLAIVQKFVNGAANSTWEKRPIAKTKNPETNNTQPKKEQNESKNASTEAVSKIKDILALMKKFENVNSQINNLKAKKELPNFKPRPNLRNNHFTDEDRQTKNLFGTILAKITKLLLPGKHRKISKKINKQTILNGNDNDVKKKLKNLFNVDLTDMSLTLKDKLVLDYLTKIKGDPNILFDSDVEDGSDSNIEGEIMMNLSEFFKIKSFIDLMKLLGKDKEDTKSNTPSLRTGKVESTTISLDTTTAVTTTTTDLTTKDPNSFENTKSKLKQHLKTILEDLVELQKEQGISDKDGKMKIADALPCIYKLLKTSKDPKNKDIKEIENNLYTSDISNIFDEMKKELKAVQNNPQSRRTIEKIPESRPKSAAVWERVIKNVDSLRKMNFRRISDGKKPKSFDELKKMIDMVQCNSKLYKTNALKADVPAADQLMLLKTLEQDVKQILEILEYIKLTLESTENLPQEQYKDLKEFVLNAASNINLDGKVAKSLNKPKINPATFDNSYVPRLNKQISFKQSEPVPLPSMGEHMSQQNLKNYGFDRDDLLNQLIRNRANQFIRQKTKNQDFTGINYNIARDIIENLDKGEVKVARELYKIFVTNKLITPKVENVNAMPRAQRTFPLHKEPLLEFQDPHMVPAPLSWSMNAESGNLLKQLLDARGSRRSMKA